MFEELEAHTYRNWTWAATSTRITHPALLDAQAGVVRRETLDFLLARLRAARECKELSCTRRIHAWLGVSCPLALVGTRTSCSGCVPRRRHRLAIAAPVAFHYSHDPGSPDRAGCGHPAGVQGRLQATKPQTLNPKPQTPNPAFPLQLPRGEKPQTPKPETKPGNRATQELSKALLALLSQEPVLNTGYCTLLEVLQQAPWIIPGRLPKPACKRV